ncbi:MAG TPA: cyclic nucleotide-gated ion channel [Xanthobacteraceae bacterium]
MIRQGKQAAGRLRRRLYEVLEHGQIADPAGRVVGRFIVVLIIVNLVAFALQSVPEYEARYHVVFEAIELFSLVVFTVEYALRVWIAVEHAPHRHLAASTARLKFIASAAGIIDLLAVMPFWLALAAPADLRVLLTFRIVRFLKLARYSPGMRSLIDALYAERRALFGCLVIMIGATLLAATVMYFIERHAQPDKFGTIPDAMWWAVVTLSTVGYGDLVPITPLGKIFGAATVVSGLVMMALPVGIVATAFADQIHRREFVVTWGMVARVPLFSELSAIEIADIMKLLRAQQFEAGAVIARRGEPAHSMYFVAAGEVEIALKREHVRLGAGHFFGEIAALRRARRSATVVAVNRTSLLVLDAHDLRALMDRQPRIAERIREMARSRLGRDKVSAQGDMLTGELEDADADERAIFEEP